MTGACRHNLEPNRDRRQAPEAAADLFWACRPKLLRMIAVRLDARLAGKVDSEDVLQDVFVEAVRRFPDYVRRPTVPVFVWLRQLTAQVLVDLHRRFLGAQRRDVHRELSPVWHQENGRGCAAWVAQLADSLTSPSQYAARHEAITQIKRLLARLDPIDREVLVLRHLEDLSNNEVAQVLGIDKFAASKRYLRALARLKSLMHTENHV